MRVPQKRRKWGTFVIGRKTIKKRMRAKLLAIKIELHRTMQPDRENRGLDETDAARASELLRGLGQPSEPVVVLQQGEAAVAHVAQAAQPNGTPQLGEIHPARRPLLSANQDATPAAISPLRRQNPREEPGALAAHAAICAGGSNPRPYCDPSSQRRWTDA